MGEGEGGIVLMYQSVSYNNERDHSALAPRVCYIHLSNHPRVLDGYESQFRMIFCIAWRAGWSAGSCIQGSIGRKENGDEGI